MATALLLCCVVGAAAILSWPAGGPVMAAESNRALTCGYASCHAPKKGVLNVHIVPHSHDDLGWLKTVDEYFYGRRNYIHDANVSAILSSVLESLRENPDRRFVQVETAFLWMWWQQQDARTQHAYRRLVQDGQLHIAGGAWSLNDEATTSYRSIIDNFSWGFRRLNDSFGPCGIPRVGWQIDSFGHSRETAAIMALMGFDGTVINRIDFQDKSSRQSTHNMEFLWLASNNLDGSAELFTSVLYDHYHPPPLCCWDMLCSDPDIRGRNSKAVVTSFLDYVQRQARYFSTDHVMVTMGNDFAYMDAKRYYRNMDKLIELVNGPLGEAGRTHAMYSTPDCYVKAVHESAPLLRTHSEDFLPYASSKDVYWTGFYTSRPTLKYLARLGSSFLQVCKQLCALSGAPGGSLDVLREAMATLQHHDAISGTARRRVVEDYARKVLAAVDASGLQAQQNIHRLVAGPGPAQPVGMTTCLLLNISQCEVSERNDHFVVTLYNPLSRPVSHYVRLPVRRGAYIVTDMDGAAQQTQVVPIPTPVLGIKTRQSDATCELVFRAVDLPALGLRSYMVKRSGDRPFPKPSRATAIGSKRLQVEVNASTGLVRSITTDGLQMSLEQNIMYYSSWGGAYIFKPNRGPTPVADTAAYTVYTGDLVDEIHQEFSDWASQVVRVYKHEEHVELEWLVGPIPMGTDVISRFSSELRTDGVFRTDSNGREMLRRRRGRRPDRRVKVTQPVAGNYYPVTARITTRDERAGLELAVLTDRPQGGSSLRDGQLELMLHRRLLKDDGMGLGESLNDREPARGRHYVLAGRVRGGRPSLEARQRLLVQRKMQQPWVFLTPASKWRSSYAHQYSGMKTTLPDNVQLLTLEPWRDNTLLVRLEHMMGKDDDELLSRNVTVNFHELLAGVKVRSARETTLDGSRWLSDMARLSWRVAHGTPAGGPHHESLCDGAWTPPMLSTCLAPMQIRTFILEVEH